MTLYVLAHFGEDLERLRLYEAVRATWYGIQMSVANFYAIFELYCPAIGTFFTPVGELGMALHEMWEVFTLSMGSLPYEEYFPCKTELTTLEKQEPALFETYRELMCHFSIYSSMHGNHKGASSSSKSWGNYLLPNLEDAPGAAYCGVANEDIFRRIKEHAQGDIVLEEDDDIYEKGDILRNFHHQARQRMSRKALLVGFLSVWLKRCVVSSFSRMSSSPLSYCWPLVWYTVVL